jgi:hypothetical protein
MKVTVTVKNQAERQAVLRAFEDPITRALVIAIGALLRLPTDRSRARVLQYVLDKLDEDAPAPEWPQ